MNSALNHFSIGIMQGRLSPPIEEAIQSFPIDSWQKEFESAKECGFECIDWIIEDRYIESNPLLTDDGLHTIKMLEMKTGVSVGAVCADYFMEFPLIRCPTHSALERIDRLLQIARKVSVAGIPYIELPFVDNSAIRTDDELKQLVNIILPILDELHYLNVTIAFETSLLPRVFSEFLKTLSHPAAKANYDTGNSASLGYNPKEEFASYGDHIVTVHIKDRLRGGATVPLGTGATNFETCFALLAECGYKGPYILQAARGPEEIEWNKRNREFVLRYIEKY